jgi:hypothetical protein
VNFCRTTQRYVPEDFNSNRCENPKHSKVILMCVVHLFLGILIYSTQFSFPVLCHGVNWLRQNVQLRFQDQMEVYQCFVWRYTDCKIRGTIVRYVRSRSQEYEAIEKNRGSYVSIRLVTTGGGGRGMETLKGRLSQDMSVTGKIQLNL